DKQYSLKLDKYRAELKTIRTTQKQLESLLKLNTELNVAALPNEVNRWDDDKNKQERFNQWLKNLQKDIYLDQALKVMSDMISQQNLVKSKETTEPVKKAF
ncbi:MAG TPA: carboxy terminal-processing peptidase, partial [Chitinophagaceae bacterium]|nr:carboxy terminal-processing peptidase [Chitinophagaceae bacterium]